MIDLIKQAMADVIMQRPKQLNKDISAWGAQIIETIKEWPGLPRDTAVQVVFSDKDENTGSAVGSVVLVISGGKPIIAPLVIKNFILEPLDVMKVGKEFYPMTRSRIGDISSGQPSFSQTPYPRAYGAYAASDISKSVLPPGYGRGMYKFFSEGEMLLPKLIVTSSRPEVDMMLREIDHDSVERYYRNGTHQVLRVAIKKLEGKHDSPDVAVAEVHGDHIKEIDPEEVEIMWVPRPSEEDRKKGFVTVLGAGGRNFDPGLINIPSETALAIFSNKSGLDINLPGRTISSGSLAGSNPYTDPVEGVKEIDMENVDRSAIIKILAADGRMETVEPYNTFARINPEEDPDCCAMIGYDELMLGERFFGKVYSNRERLGESYGVGLGRSGYERDTNSVFFSKRDGKLVGPFDVTSRSCSTETINGELVSFEIMKGSDDRGKVKIMKSSMFKDIGYAPSKGTTEYFIPEDWDERDIRKVKTSAKSPGEVGYLAKTAHDLNKDWMFVKNYGDHVSLDLPAPVKMAYEEELGKVASFTLSDLSPDIAEFIMISSGIEKNAAAEMLANSDHNGTTYYGVSYRPVVNHSEKLAADRQLYQLKEAFANNIRCWLVKEASVVGDVDTVDAMLGLGLANPENVDQYIEAIPKFEEISTRLANTLMKARTSGSPIAVEYLRKAMLAIENVIEQARSYVAAKSILNRSVKT